MSAQSDARLLDRFGIELPIIQAPMAGATTPEMVIAVSEAGGLGSFPSALFTPDELRKGLDAIRAGSRPRMPSSCVSHTGFPGPARELKKSQRTRNIFQPHLYRQLVEAATELAQGEGWIP